MEKLIEEEKNAAIKRLGEFYTASTKTQIDYILSNSSDYGKSFVLDLYTADENRFYTLLKYINNTEYNSKEENKINEVMSSVRMLAF